jgi:hypothetical protein
MFGTKSPLSTSGPPELDVKPVNIIGQINPAGQEEPEIRDAQQAALEAQLKYAKSLEERYAQPNWYRIAAAFAKPQLGGFIASLGSAADVAGENLEMQRAVAPTIERMRAEVAAGQAGLSQRNLQERLSKELDSEGWKDPVKMMRAYRLDPKSAIGEAIAKNPAFQQERRAETGFNIGLQEKFLDKPALITEDPVYKNISPTQKDKEEHLRNLNAVVPPGVDPKAWATMPYTDRLNAVAKFQDEKAKQGLSEGTAFGIDAERAHNVIDQLADLRQLAADKSLEPVFSLAKNGDIFSMVRAYMNKNPGSPNDAIEGLVEAAMKNVQNPDNATRAKVDKLVKGIYSLEMRLRGSTINPTDAASALVEAASPSLSNSKGGFIGILDQLALNASRDIGKAKLYHQLREKGLVSGQAAFNDAMEGYRSQMRDLSRQYATQYPSESFPEWYGLRGKSEKKNPPNAAPAQQPSARPASQSNASSSPPVVIGDDDPKYKALSAGQQYIYNGMVRTKK